VPRYVLPTRIDEEIVVEVELHDMACPGAAPHAGPPAAVLASPRSQRAREAERDVGSHGPWEVEICAWLTPMLPRWSTDQEIGLEQFVEADTYGSGGANREAEQRGN
jgi:hypothetical protein